MIIKEKEKITGDFIDDAVLRSVDDLEHHLRPTDNYIKDIETLPYIFVNGVRHLEEFLEHNSKIAIVCDSDMDGITSTSIMYQFLVDDLKYSNVEVIQHSEKAHGLTNKVMSEIKRKKYDFVILPDASTNDIEQQDELIKNKIGFLIIDHHDISRDINNRKTDVLGLVINNQELDVNKEFTGAGMTYIFCKYFAHYYQLDIDVDKYLDLVALGQIADVSDVSDPEIRYYVYKGLNNIVNPFIKAVMEQKSLDALTGRDASFSIISMCNAVARIGTVEEKNSLINAFTQDTNETVTITKKKKNKSTGKFDKIEEEVSMYTYIVLECEKIKRRQDKMVKDAMNNIEILQDEVIVLAHSKGTPTAINGLIAMKLADKYKKPVLVTNNIYGDDIKGSARCPYDFDFKQYLLDSYLMNYAQGHAQAFGWSISIDDFEDLQQYFNRHPINHDPIHYVDKIFTKPEESDIIQVEVNKHIYGGKVEYALFAYTEVSFNKFCINKRGSMLTLFDNGVTFVMFNVTDELYEELLSNMKNNFVSVDIVGEPRLSNFTGKTRTEVIIKDIEIAEKHENEFGIDF